MQKLEPTILVIFGATGELTSTRLLPALYRMAENNLLPEKFAVVGFSRTGFTHAQFRKTVKQNLRKYCDTIAPTALSKFLSKIYYSPGNIHNSTDFAKLSKQITALENSRGGHVCANRLFYYATLPSHYESLSQELNQSGLLIGCKLHQRKNRVLLEKPFGRDLASARKLNDTLHQYFQEKQIYRIDHYLGKETVEKLLAAEVKPEAVDHIQISALEESGIGRRGALYEQMGALRDIVQNHLLQLVALTAAQEPTNREAETLRDARAEVLSTIRQPNALELKDYFVVGQYQSYLLEPNVSAKSKTETFAASRLFLDYNKWGGTPFYLRTGKKLKKKCSQVLIKYKNGHTEIFEFRSEDGAYERLLLDFMQGDQRLFARTDEIEYSWKYIDVLENYLKKHSGFLQIYPDGSFGPTEAEKLIQKDKRTWKNP